MEGRQGAVTVAHKKSAASIYVSWLSGSPSTPHQLLELLMVKEAPDAIRSSAAFPGSLNGTS